MIPPFDPDEIAGSFKAPRGLDISAAARYEDSCVRQVLKYLKLSSAVRGIADAVNEKTGKRLCNFAMMHHMVPNMPVRFTCSRIKRVANIPLSDLFGRFEKTAIYRAFHDARHSSPGDAPICLLFPYTGTQEVPGPKGGRFMTIHDCCHEEPDTSEWTKIVWQWVTIELLEGFILSEFAEWRPS